MEDAVSSIEEQQKKRQKTVTRTSYIGIAANAALVVFKLIAGLAASSVAIILDAVNNLTDAVSSLVTIIGAKFAGREPDREHPLGHGRAEYLSAMVVSAIVLYAGITSLVEAFKNVFEPRTPKYTTLTLVILGVAIAVKLVLGLFVRRTGRRVNSGALVASGADALFDALVSASVLASAIVYEIWGVNLETYVGLLISILIIKSGYDMLRESLDEILGKRADIRTVRAIKATIRQEPQVIDAYDMILHSYGPDLMIGSVHVEIPDTMTMNELDTLERRITERVYRKYGVLMGAVGIYPVNTSDAEAMEIRDAVYDICGQHPEVLQVHGFYLDKENKQIRFDVIADFESDRKATAQEIHDEVTKKYPDYQVLIQNDTDFDL
ncbi:MAG: cation transporter [Clostridia bacterium]|nr:cation transporter [Clostridia bacterium]